MPTVTKGFLSEKSFATTGLKIDRQIAVDVLMKAGMKVISDKVLLGFTTKMLLEIVPDRFFTMPPSTTGHYHPRALHKWGGLVLHTCRNLHLLNILLAGSRFSPSDCDVAITATVLHDCTKSGKGWGPQGKGTSERHPESAAQLILDNDGPVLVSELVLNHMGPYRPDDLCVRASTAMFVLPFSFFDALHLAVYWADLISSRREVWLPENKIPTSWLKGKPATLAQWGI